LTFVSLFAIYEVQNWFVHLQLVAARERGGRERGVQTSSVIGWRLANEMGLLLYTMMSRNPPPRGCSEMLTLMH